MKHPVTQGKKSFKRAVLDKFEEQDELVKKLRLDLRKIVEEEVLVAVRPLEAGLALREANLLKRLLIEKGVITEEEFLAKLRG